MASLPDAGISENFTPSPGLVKQTTYPPETLLSGAFNALPISCAASMLKVCLIDWHQPKS